MGVGEGVGALFWKSRSLANGLWSLWQHAPPPGNAPHAPSPRILGPPLRVDQRCGDWPRAPLVPIVGRDAPEGRRVLGPD